MSAAPRVSVIVPAHNYGRYLDDCLRSILEQDVPELEVIVIDDASSDDTQDVLGRRRDARLLRLRNDKCLGATATINRGLGLARGDVITILDADDLMLPGCVGRHLGVFDRHPDVGLTHANARLIDEAGVVFGLAKRPGSGGDVSVERAFGRLLAGNFMVAASVFVRAACYRSVGLYDSRLAHGYDWDMWLRIARDFATAYIDEPLAARRLHRASMSSGNYRTHDDLLSRELILEKALATDGGPPAGRSREQVFGRAYFGAVHGKLGTVPRREVLRLLARGAQRYPRALTSRAAALLVLKLGAYTLLPRGAVERIRLLRYRSP
jgi:glycosyltransferase involved in cell wall biosynthesis